MSKAFKPIQGGFFEVKKPVTGKPSNWLLDHFEFFWKRIKKKNNINKVHICQRLLSQYKVKIK